jgi:hypothetical protein
MSFPAITDPAQKYFKDGQWTYDGSAWRPQDQLIAYRDVVRETWSNTEAAAGTNYHDFLTIAAGYVFIIQGVFAVNVTTAASNVDLYIRSGGINYYIMASGGSTPSNKIQYIGALVLKSGEVLRVAWNGCVLYDDIYAWVAGYKFLVAE